MFIDITVSHTSIFEPQLSTEPYKTDHNGSQCLGHWFLVQNSINDFDRSFSFLKSFILLIIMSKKI